MSVVVSANLGATARIVTKTFQKDLKTDTALGTIRSRSEGINIGGAFVVLN